MADVDSCSSQVSEGISPRSNGYKHFRRLSDFLFRPIKEEPKPTLALDEIVQLSDESPSNNKNSDSSILSEGDDEGKVALTYDDKLGDIWTNPNFPSTTTASNSLFKIPCPYITDDSCSELERILASTPSQKSKERRRLQKRMVTPASKEARKVCDSARFSRSRAAQRTSLHIYSITCEEGEANGEVRTNSYWELCQEEDEPQAIESESSPVVSQAHAGDSAYDVGSSESFEEPCYCEKSHTLIKKGVTFMESDIADRNQANPYSWKKSTLYSKDEKLGCKPASQVALCAGSGNKQLVLKSNISPPSADVLSARSCAQCEVKICTSTPQKSSSVSRHSLKRSKQRKRISRGKSATGRLQENSKISTERSKLSHRVRPRKFKSNHSSDQMGSRASVFSSRSLQLRRTGTSWGPGYAPLYRLGSRERLPPDMHNLDAQLLRELIHQNKERIQRNRMISAAKSSSRCRKAPQLKKSRSLGRLTCASHNKPSCFTQRTFIKLPYRRTFSLLNSGHHSASLSLHSVSYKTKNHDTLSCSLVKGFTAKESSKTNFKKLSKQKSIVPNEHRLINTKREATNTSAKLRPNKTILKRKKKIFTEPDHRKIRSNYVFSLGSKIHELSPTTIEKCTPQKFIKTFLPTECQRNVLQPLNKFSIPKRNMTFISDTKIPLKCKASRQNIFFSPTGSCTGPLISQKTTSKKFAENFSQKSKTISEKPKKGISFTFSGRHTPSRSVTFRFADHRNISTGLTVRKKANYSSFTFGKNSGQKQTSNRKPRNPSSMHAPSSFVLGKRESDQISRVFSVRALNSNTRCSVSPKFRKRKHDTENKAKTSMKMSCGAASNEKQLTRTASDATKSCGNEARDEKEGIVLGVLKDVQEASVEDALDSLGLSVKEKDMVQMALWFGSCESSSTNEVEEEASDTLSRLNSHRKYYLLPLYH